MTKFFSFKVEPNAVLFAGSRNKYSPFRSCSDLIKRIRRARIFIHHRLCQRSRRIIPNALLKSEHKAKAVVACAFKDRADKLKGLLPLFVVPDNLPPRAALAKRTLWMTSRCSILILFPSEPIGKGSALAFRSAILNNKPVFIAQYKTSGKQSLYSDPSNLFGVVDGFWCVPPVYQQTDFAMKQHEKEELNETNNNQEDRKQEE